MTATAVWFCGSSSIACNCGSSVEIKPLLDTITLPETLKLPDIVLRSDSTSPRCQNRSPHRDTRCSSRGTLATLPAENDGRPDSPPGPDVQQHAIEALRQSDQLLHTEIATPALPQLVNHLRKPRPAAIARWHDWTSSVSPVRKPPLWRAPVRSRFCGISYRASPVKGRGKTGRPQKIRHPRLITGTGAHRCSPMFTGLNGDSWGGPGDRGSSA